MTSVNPSQEEFCRLWGQLIARAWTDEPFKQRLVREPEAVLKEHGFELDPGSRLQLKVVESNDQVQHLYFPCEGELPDGGGSAEAGDLSSECLNNRLVLARLAALREAPSSGLRLHLRAGVTVSDGASGEVLLKQGDAEFAFRQVPPGIRAALLRLGGDGDEDQRLCDLVSRSDGPEALPRWQRMLRQLGERGLTAHSLDCDGIRLLTVVPVSPSAVFPWRAIDPDRQYLLSRFTCLRRDGGGLILESPLSHARVLVQDARIGALVQALCQAGTPAALAQASAGLPAAAVTGALGVLVATALADVASDGDAATDASPALQTWDFHELLFHSRSRAGRHDLPFGGVFRGGGRFAPPPAVKRQEAREWIPLPRPDLARLEREDPPYAQVQEQRRTIRTYGARPLDVGQLGEFLHRVGRVRHHEQVEIDVPGRGPRPLEVAFRPYPGGGGLYELELYAAVNACDGVPAGLHHYDALEHRLGRVRDRDDDVDQLLAYAARSTGVDPRQLQVLIIVAARFQRLSWKYASCAYALTLKHVGVLFQTMYLSATAMGLAPCALGAGDADRFARAAGTDYYAETSVGEFLLGSKP
jgi:SagB-type dehydrogenase family enzyme